MMRRQDTPVIRGLLQQEGEKTYDVGKGRLLENVFFHIKDDFMTRTILVQCFGLAITAHLAAVPGLASAQKLEYRVVSAQKKWEYRDLLKIIEVKSPYADARPSETKDETKPSETKSETQPAKMTKAEAKPAETVKAETNPAEATNKDQLPTIDWRSLRWHMSMEQVATSSRNITPTTTSERRDHRNPEVGVALLKARYVAQEIQYTALYWFHDDRLVAVAIKPRDARHWPKVNAGLEQTYGAPSDDKSRTTSIGAMQCVVTDRKWISERDSKAIKFVAQDCNQNEHLNFYSVRYEPILTTMAAAAVTSPPFGPTGVR